MSSSGQKKAVKKDYYLLEDRFLGLLVYYYHQGGRYTLALLALAFAVPAVYIVWRSYSKGQFWVGLLNLLPSAVFTLPILLMVNVYHLCYIFASKCVASKAVLGHIVRELNVRCSNGSVINWRQVAHSANKYSEELGESHVVFYDGCQCMHYFLHRIVYVVCDNWSVFERRNDLVFSAVKEYKARIQSFCEKSEALDLPLSECLEEQKIELGI